MKEKWNERYGEEKFAYGKEPNVFLKETLIRLNPTGRALFPAEGEGRNAVFAASLGFETFAFDISIEGKKKAISLANERNVKINYEVGKFEELELFDKKFDLVVLIYAHFPPPVRKKYFQKFIEMLNPGGFVILEAFSISNLEYRINNPDIGGPPVEDLLYTTEIIEKEFADLKTILLEEIEIVLSEGLYHNGKGKVIRYIGKKEM